LRESDRKELNAKRAGVSQREIRENSTSIKGAQDLRSRRVREEGERRRHIRRVASKPDITVGRKRPGRTKPTWTDLN